MGRWFLRELGYGEVVYTIETDRHLKIFKARVLGKIDSGTYKIVFEDRDKNDEYCIVDSYDKGKTVYRDDLYTEEEIKEIKEKYKLELLISEDYEELSEKYNNLYEEYSENLDTLKEYKEAILELQNDVDRLHTKYNALSKEIEKLKCEKGDE